VSRLKAAEPHGLDVVRRLTFRMGRRMYRRQLEPSELGLALGVASGFAT
jgi:hypothetical protein